MKCGLGLVLSGGGTRGVVHIGVLKALTEQGIYPDCIAGSSSGALVGALYAAGYGPDEMLKFFLDKNPFRFSNLAFGKPGWIDTEKIVSDFLEYFPQDTFESLGKRLFVTATDLFNGDSTIFESGPLIAPLLASCSLPPIFTPTVIDGRRYSDGGITNNFPVEPLENLCRRIIGVYASPVGPENPARLKSSVAVWKRAMKIGTYFAAKSKFDRCDFVVCPQDLGRYRLFGTRHIKAIYEIGYKAALAEMESIQRVAAVSG